MQRSLNLHYPIRPNRGQKKDTVFVAENKAGRAIHIVSGASKEEAIQVFFR